MTSYELAEDDPTEEVLPANDDPTEEEVIDSEWRGLHPLSLVANLAPRTWRTLRGTWPLLAAFAIGGRRDSVAILFIAALFFGMAVWSTVLHFLTLRYRVVHGRLEMRSGLLNRQNRALDPSRIQNTELVRNPLHKLLGLVELRVETASGREVEGLLSALSERKASGCWACSTPRGQAQAPPQTTKRRRRSCRAQTLVTFFATEPPDCDSERESPLPWV